jgi:uncharacterized protein YjbI with pentapeptide repeats
VPPDRYSPLQYGRSRPPSPNLYSIDPRRWVPVVLNFPATLGFSCCHSFANFREEELSARPAHWTGRDKDDIALVKGARIRGRDLQHATGRGAFLVKADLRASDLRGIDLTGADLQGARFEEDEVAGLKGANLERANLQEATLQGANFTRTLFQEADLTWADLRGANFEAADLRNAMLVQADLTPADQQEVTRLGWAKLENANLAGAKLHKADLKQADLRGAKLIGTDLAEADLTGAQLQGAILLEEDFAFEHTVRTPTTLQEHLLTQLLATTSDGGERRVGAFLIGNIGVTCAATSRRPWRSRRPIGLSSCKYWPSSNPSIPRGWGLATCASACACRSAPSGWRVHSSTLLSRTPCPGLSSGSRYISQMSLKNSPSA